MKSCLLFCAFLLALPLRADESFRGVARLQTLQTKEKKLEARAQYPVFQAQTPLARFANSQMRAEVRKDYFEFLKQSHKDFVDLQDEKITLPPYDYQVEPLLNRFVARWLISVCFQHSIYCGGAHGIDFLSTANFAVINGRPKRLVLGDLFLPGAAYRPLISDQILAKLRKTEGADWVKDGTVKALDTGQFNNFSIRKTGLQWHFAPYDMGPYAAGPFDVELSWKELGPSLRAWVKA